MPHAKNGPVWSRRRFLTNSGLLASSAATLLPQRLSAAQTSSVAAGLPDTSTAKTSLGNGPLKLPFNVPQHFFDDSLIAYQRKLVRRWLPAYVNHEPVLVPDRPWEEQRVLMRGSILPAPDGGYRMYYVGGGHVLVAFSDDGLKWQKPELNICPWEGRPSNILIQRKKFSIAFPSVIVDDQDAKYPYKMTTYQKPDKTKEGGLYVYQSTDGLHWEAIPGPRFDMGDRHTMMDSRVDGKFVGYVRKTGFQKTIGCRSVFYVESDNFLDWAEPQLALAPDLDDEPDVEYYGMGVFRRNGWFIGLLEYWHADQDAFEIQLAFSRNGKVWERPHLRPAFIAPSYDWNRRGLACISNGPIYIQEQMAFYIGGSSSAHSLTSIHKDGVIGVASLEADRFCALEGTTGEGWIDTVPLVWPGGELVINADTRESFASHPTYTGGGVLFVEVLDETGKQLPEWSAKKRAVFQGNTHCREKISDGTVRWPGGRNLDEFTGRAIRLRFGMKHARLFTFHAGKSFSTKKREGLAE